MWGRLVETAVGLHLVNESSGKAYEVYYWRDRDREVDYVLKQGNALVGIEVKSGRKRKSSGMPAFKKKYNPQNIFIVGSGGIPVRDFLESAPETLFNL